MCISLLNPKWAIHGRASSARRLVCLPYAGGSASFFRDWMRDLAPQVEVWAVQLPGRENRLREPPLRRIEDMVAAMLEALTPLFDEPYTLFGHSMGGILAFELARVLCGMPGRAPQRLIVSGSLPPHLHHLRRSRRIHELPQAELVHALHRFGGLPEPVLEHEELFDVILPAVRADFEAMARYEGGAPARLLCDVSAYAGEDDETSPPSLVAQWEGYSARRTRLQVFSGGHFFIRSAREELLDHLRREVA